MNLFELFVKIGVKDEATNNLSKIAGNLGNGLKTAAQIGVAAVSVAASGITALTSAAVKNYAEYEQLVGGVETLFKDSSNRVQEYAANAYQTAGLSANQYMETVTSFSASLLQSLEGDTQAAADLADMAIRDMSDNANKMGTDMQTITNTYQSLARGNYAMLDNLKLGFGGTKAEMERLIETAARLDSSVKSNDMSFANIVKAIHAVQTEMGITGTTALEASTTIQGSVAMMVASWQNLLTGIADGNADMEVLIGNFVDSVGIAFGNLIPVIENALNGAADLINQLLPQLFEALPQVVSDVLPKLAEAAVNVIQALVDGIASNQPALVDSAFNVVMTLANGIIQLLPEIINAGVQLVANLVIGLAQALPELIPATVDMVVQIVETLADNLDLIIEAALQLVEGLADGLIAALPVLIDATPELVVTIVTTIIENLPKIIDMGIQIVVSLVKGILQSLPNIADAAVNMVNGLIQGIVESWPTLVENFSNLIDTLISTIKSILGIHSPSTVFASIGGNVATGFGDGFAEMFAGVQSRIISAIQGLVSQAKEAVAEIQAALKEANEMTADIMADSGTVNSGLEGAQKRGKVATGNTTTNNYNIYAQTQTATEVIKETRYINNRAVMTN